MKSLANKNILITGGAGFIGSHIADIAVQEGGIVTCYDNLCRGSLNNIAHLLDKNGDQFRFVHADVRDNRFPSPELRAPALFEGARGQLAEQA